MTSQPLSIDSAEAEIAARILEAARIRFERYGFNKTTMAEIARDCGMSAGNIYRYFKNKGEIAAVGASCWLTAAEARLAAIAGQTGEDPIARLRRLLKAHLALVAELVSSHSHLDELVDHVCETRPDLLAGHIHAVRAEIAKVLEAGMASGQLAPGRSMDLAAAIQSATSRFTHHSFVRSADLPELERDLDRVVDLLLTGLRRRDEKG